MRVRSDQIRPISVISCTPGFAIAMKAVHENDHPWMAGRLRALLWDSLNRRTAILDAFGTAAGGQRPVQAAENEEDIEKDSAHARCC